MMMNIREISAEDGPSASLESDVIEFREPCYTTVGDGDVHHAV